MRASPRTKGSRLLDDAPQEPGTRGPKGAHRLTPEVIADIATRRATGATGASYRKLLLAIPA